MLGCDPVERTCAFAGLITVSVLTVLLDAVAVSDTAPRHETTTLVRGPTVIGLVVEPPAGAMTVEIGIGLFIAAGIGLLLNFLISVTIGVYFIAAAIEATKINSSNSLGIQLR